ncbi:MAG: hypothetical protein QM802_25655 [Agriterribacter sp.]
MAAKKMGYHLKPPYLLQKKPKLQEYRAEYKWIKEHYSDYKVKGQSLTYKNKKPYDIITITFSDGKELPIYFDISNYFGKF